MKAISLTQPWAQLMADGRKHIETRSWDTRYRGWLAIAASKGWTVADRDCAEAFGYDPAILPRGAIVAIGRLHQTFRTGSSDQFTLVPPGSEEEQYGNYEPDRYGWRFTEIRKLAQPVACKGALGLWTVPPDVAARVRELVAGGSPGVAGHE